MAPEVTPSPEDLPSNADKDFPSQESLGTDNGTHIDDSITVAVYDDEFQNDSDENNSFDVNDGYTALGQLSSDDDENDEFLDEKKDEADDIPRDGYMPNIDGNQSQYINASNENFSSVPVNDLMNPDRTYQSNSSNWFNNDESSDACASTKVNHVQKTPVSSTATGHQQTINTARISMTQAHADVVIKAMAGFKLPSDNIPEWAKHIPEERWKANLKSKIKK